ncbi:murein DD-endopeptidase MepM/ murein hydrolase activator NlpD [Diaminobutyricimonas aerilata]|uniref:Murein DD-endopeptidase MepM/ murein hydrolase activator NlpD n=1 Tax=Diaminobutyricimonas aerilata TaxID=1162967 RepID=A0A2M9CGA2_9MICO|nr:M23 family metallopeptidase [Diaminobutyricimonas aerilata]PJJ70943.1 murein DD-endopeptidase MepM/ murein hydrolase activator NlpD [Diaminobutyricimonas aerilata]
MREAPSGGLSLDIELPFIDPLHFERSLEAFDGAESTTTRAHLRPGHPLRRSSLLFHESAEPREGDAPTTTSDLAFLGLSTADEPRPATAAIPILVDSTTDQQFSSRRERREQERSNARRPIRRRPARPVVESTGTAPDAIQTPRASTVEELVGPEPARDRVRRRKAKAKSRTATRPPRAPRAGAAAGPSPIPVATAADQRSLRERVAGKLLSSGVILFTGAMLVGLTVPANLFTPQSSTASTTFVEATGGDTTIALQNVETAAGVAPTVSRDNYTVTSYAEQLKAKYGNRNFTYVASGTGAIRWPFPYAVPITDGYGARTAPCRGCSTQHKGVDFVPGNGAPIYAIADGVVSTHEEGGGLGNHVFLEHIVDGQEVRSVYAHMQWGSSPLVEGQEVKVGDFIGLTGETGQATGPHLHFEIWVNGEHVNPFDWLQTHAG